MAGFVVVLDEVWLLVTLNGGVVLVMLIKVAGLVVLSAGTVLVILNGGTVLVMLNEGTVLVMLTEGVLLVALNVFILLVVFDQAPVVIVVNVPVHSVVYVVLRPNGAELKVTTVFVVGIAGSVLAIITGLLSGHGEAVVNVVHGAGIVVYTVVGVCTMIVVVSPTAKGVFVTVIVSVPVHPVVIVV